MFPELSNCRIPSRLARHISHEPSYKIASLPADAFPTVLACSSALIASALRPPWIRVYPAQPRVLLDDSPFVAVEQRYPCRLDRVRRLGQRRPHQVTVGKFLHRHDVSLGRGAGRMLIGFDYFYRLEVRKIFQQRLAQR